MNVAVTERAALIVTVHAPVPEQSPLQPVKLEPASAAAVSVTVLPDVNGAEQVVPQLIPGGLDVTVPEPLPAFVTVTAGEEPEALNAASASTSPEPKLLFGTTVLPPQPVPPPPTAGLAVLVNSCFVAAMLRTRSGRADHNRATTPTTCGPAIEVPLNDEYAVSLVRTDERTLTPGATISGFIRFEPSTVTGPLLLKPASVLLLSTAPVENADE